jgi:predicted nuclease of predicted toxin-antitoxin system
MLPEIKLPELHDRIIVATAKILKAKLITKDKDIVRIKISGNYLGIDLFLSFLFSFR